MTGLEITRGRLLAFVLGFVCLLGVSAGVAPAENCRGRIENARLAATNTLDTSTMYVFAVDATSDVTCSNVVYELEVHEQLSTGEQRMRKIPYRQRVRDFSGGTKKVNYRVNRGNSLIRWDFKVTACYPCGTQPDR